MNIDQLKYFLKLAERNHMARTADDLYISEAALSKSIMRLEDEVGAKLFDRTGRNIALNDMGRIFLPYAQTAVKAVSDGISELSQVTGSQKIRMQSTPMVLFPGLFDSILEKFPDISISDSLDADAQLIENLLSGKTALCMTNRLLSHPHITRYPVRQEPLFLVTNAEYPLLSQGFVTADQLKDEKIINTRVKASMHKNIIDLFASCKIKLNMPFLICNLNEILSFVARGLGVSIMPSSIFRDLMNREFLSKTRDNIRTIAIVDGNGSSITVSTALYWCDHHDCKMINDLRILIIKYFRNHRIDEFRNPLLDQ